MWGYSTKSHMDSIGLGEEFNYDNAKKNAKKMPNLDTGKYVTES